MFEQTFKNIDDILHKDAGCSSELDYIEQTSWVLFLKYLDDLEKEKKMSTELSGVEYKAIVENEYKWETWAVPKNQLSNYFQIAKNLRNIIIINGNAEGRRLV
jgi:type I restriction enzyme M protein